MGRRSQVKIKKLALAYGTGWEYLPGDGEAGSVLTDIFLDMWEENWRRYEQVWRKQELEFQKAVPERRHGARELSGELAVRVSGGEHGKWLEEGSQAYLFQEQGTRVRFQTLRPLQLTAARLQYAVYSRGFCAWLAFQAGQGEEEAFPLFEQSGEELCHPVFRWFFRGLCDGMGEFRFQVEFHSEISHVPALSGKWTISCGEVEYPVRWTQTETGCWLEGSTPGFALNLEKDLYQIRLEFSPEEEPEKGWVELLCGGYSLKEAGQEREPDLCLTDSGTGEGGMIFPFGTSPEEACCCYLACDRIMAGAERIRLRFRESRLREEKLPEPHSEKEEKLYKKYPWLRRTEAVQEWQAQESLWEYFNGNLWRPLSGSEAWKTGCGGQEEGEKSYTWKCPRDMKPCVVEGEEHFYIRLRLCRVRNAYAMYYRKEIPVLEEIRFSRVERRLQPVESKIPDREEAGGGTMYLGFDRDVTPDNCWYTGTGPCSFAKERILGPGIRFGREAFWVELTEKGEENMACFQANYLPVRSLPMEDMEAGQIRKGDVFTLEPHGMGTLEAVCLSDILCEHGGAPVLSKRQAGENYFAHYGRLLTPMDLELMLQERYPAYEVRSCEFRQEESVLAVELVCREKPGKGKDVRAAGSAAQGKQQAGDGQREAGADRRQADKPEDGDHDRLAEIERWLEEVLAADGPVWLQDCGVTVTLSVINNPS